MRIKKMTSSQKAKRYRLRSKAKHLTDALGDLKEDKKIVCEAIQATTDELKEIFQALQTNESIGDYYRSVYDEYEKESTDWKLLAMTFKPTKARIKKFTTSDDIERLRTYEI